MGRMYDGRAFVVAAAVELAVAVGRMYRGSPFSASRAPLVASWRIATGAPSTSTLLTCFAFLFRSAWLSLRLACCIAACVAEFGLSLLSLVLVLVLVLLSPVA
jgi:hypothetical protein